MGVFAMREKVFCFFPCCLGPFVRGRVSLHCNLVGRYFSASLQYNFLLIDQKKKKRKKKAESGDEKITSGNGIFSVQGGILGIFFYIQKLSFVELGIGNSLPLSYRHQLDDT